jgi:two-component system, chemotaxis family, CheB/CheR fusion protein
MACRWWGSGPRRGGSRPWKPSSRASPSRRGWPFVEVDHIYVIPPDHNLASLDGKIELVPRSPSGFNRAPIDLLLSSLAESHGNRAAGVILSGSDGALGLRRIHEAGGATLVQEPGEAEFPKMPEAALRAGSVDALLPAADLGA